MFEEGIPAALRQNVRLCIVDTVDTLTRCIAQVVADPSLGPVFRTLFSYQECEAGQPSRQGSEVHCVPVGRAMFGRTYQEIMFGFPRAIPIGYIAAIADASPDRDSRLVLNPPPGSESANHRFRDGDRIVAIAERRVDVQWSPVKGRDLEAFTSVTVADRPRAVLLLGEGPRSLEVLHFLPDYLPRGSTVHTNFPAESAHSDAQMFRQIQLETDHMLAANDAPASTLSIVDLVQATPAEQLNLFDTIALVAEPAGIASHDERVLMALTALRARTRGSVRRPSTVIELINPHNYELAKAFGEPTAVISSELVSNYMVQLTRVPDRGLVFDELLDPRDNEIYTRPAERYVRDSQERVSFDQIRMRAYTLHETAIGYCPPGGVGLRLCPHERTKKMAPSEFGRIVVLAREVDISARALPK
jgi:hypothetical protein